MADSATPWIGLVALAAMFIIPFLPDWLFEGPRTIRHRPRRHLCAACGAAWTSFHACEPAGPEPVLPPRQRLTGELRRLDR